MKDVWTLVPAAGKGSRMGGGPPKQYRLLAGKPILEWSLERAAAHPRVAGVVVALAAADRHWGALSPRLEVPIRTVTGGAERCHSVLAALEHLAGAAAPGAWVLVHDAARPCLRPADLAALITQATAHPVGGLLAVPARDTMKRRAGDGTVAETVDRRELWHALTPQLFRLGALRDAITAALAAGIAVTDEAQAMELAGARPLLVPGHADNIKVTEPLDAVLAEAFLRSQEARSCA